MKYSIIAAALALFTAGSAAAQTDADALRFSMLNYGSTARSLGMGNSFGALGADFSSLATNPGGIAFYRRSEFSFSPQFSNRTINANFLKEDQTDNFFKFSFGNLGLVLANPKANSNGWKGVAFGVGYNKTNDFSGSYIAEGGNAKNSLLDSYLEDVDDLNPDDIAIYYPYDAELAWQTFLLDTFEFGGNFYYFNALPYAGALQRKSVITRGGSGEWDFTLGGNYEDVLYMGFTLGVTSLRYEEESTWEEIDDQDTIPYFDNYVYTTDLRTTGSGFNMKFGMIYKPNDFFRFGAAIHSPTWYSLTDEYSSSITTDLEDGAIREWDGPEFIPFEYNVNTPFRAIGSLAIIFAKQGAFNVDYEFTDYGQARIRPQDRSFSSEFTPVNKAISRKYTMSHNVRAGLEWRYEELRFRAGGFYSTSPFEENLRDSEKTDMTRYGLTAGFGFRTEKYFFDAAYAWSRTGSYLQPYTLNNQDTEGITFTQTDNRVMFTVGWLF